MAYHHKLIQTSTLLAANCMRDYGTTNNTPAHQALPVWRAPEGLEDLTAAQVGDGGACQHTNDKPDRSGAPRGLRGLAAVPVGDGGAAPVTWRCTRYVAVHPNRRGVMPDVSRVLWRVS